MVSVSDGKNCWSGSPKDLNWAALDGQEWLSHNAAFDRSVYRRLVQLGKVPQCNIPAWHCTANFTAYLCNRRALDSAVEHLWKIKLDKQVRADSCEKRWSQDFSKEEQDAMLKYAKDDALWCWRIWDKYGAQWPAMERRLSDLTIRQGEHGCQIDTELLENYMLWSWEARTECEQIIPWIKDAEEPEWDEFNTKPTSTKCIAEQCRRTGIDCPPVKNEDEEGYIEWEEKYAPANPWIIALGAWRSINKLYKTFETMKRRLRADGTMPFGLLYFGSHTGRWAGTAKINFQNMRKEPVFVNEKGLPEMDDKRNALALRYRDEFNKWPDWVRHAIDFRAIILPRPGKKMILCDLAQIEPRVLAHICGNKELLKLMGEGMSIYEAFNRTAFGYTGGKMNKATKEYKLVKIQVLQLGYQAGWAKFIKTALKESGMDLTENDPEFVQELNQQTGKMEQVSGYGQFAKKIVKDFREANPRITGLWKRLDEAFKNSLGDTFRMELPSGRKLTYEDVRCDCRITVGENGKPEKKYEFTARTGERRRAFYGGALTENLIQGAARDVFGFHLAELDRQELPALFSSHDEGIFEVDESIAQKDIESAMSVCPEWLMGCPIAGEAQTVDHYKK
jgi:hypothetical protein